MLVVQPGEFHHVVTSRGVGAVGTDEEVERDGDLGWSVLLVMAGVRGGRLILGRVLRVICSFFRGGTLLLFKPGGLGVEVCPCQLMVEV